VLVLVFVATAVWEEEEEPLLLLLPLLTSWGGETVSGIVSGIGAKDIGSESNGDIAGGVLALLLCSVIILVLDGAMENMSILPNTLSVLLEILSPLPPSPPSPPPTCLSSPNEPNVAQSSKAAAVPSCEVS
jgi:hypothetical protein